jgi:hydrogenase maturation protein HypF
VPCDDSVVRVVDGAVVLVRRSRGYAPLPVVLPVPVAPTLAAGGDLKGVCCVASGDQAWMSQHLGDLATLPGIGALARTAGDLAAFHGLEPERVVADAHPGYRSRRWAQDRASATGAALVTVQHHRAHVAAAMAEHGIGTDVEVTGIAMDGTGYGDDGTVWGGELLRGTYADLERIGHLRTFGLPGGDAAVRHPARVAVSLLLAAGIDPIDDLAPVAAMGPEATAIVRRQVERRVHTVSTSSMGRLFDAVASLLDLAHEVSFEGQAAMALEAAAADHGPLGSRSVDGASSGGPSSRGRRSRAGEPELRFELGGGVASPLPVVGGIVDGWRAGRPVPALAAAFHQAVVDLLVRWAEHADREIVVLSGGVFQNVELLRRGTAALRSAGFDVRTHRVVPANDGGLALGQAVLGQAVATGVPGARVHPEGAGRDREALRRR